MCANSCLPSRQTDSRIQCCHMPEPQCTASPSGSPGVMHHAMTVGERPLPQAPSLPPRLLAFWTSKRSASADVGRVSAMRSRSVRGEAGVGKHMHGINDAAGAFAHRHKPDVSCGLQVAEHVSHTGGGRLRASGRHTCCNAVSPWHVRYAAGHQPKPGAQCLLATPDMDGALLVTPGHPSCRIEGGLLSSNLPNNVWE